MPLTRFHAKLAIPPCVIGIRTEGTSVAQIAFLPPDEAELSPQNALAEQAAAQIVGYVADADFRFRLPLLVGGTAFQRRVWDQISAIGPGKTRTYGELAAALSSAARAVGQACGANALPLVVPCHRVVAAAGLGGFAHHDRGYLPRVKRWLLDHESGSCT